MPVPRPKILTAITVPSGGWQLKFYITPTAGPSLNQAVTATISAGDYFLSWDNQSDDFLYALTSAMKTAIYALGGEWDNSGGDAIGANVLAASITTGHKVEICFEATKFGSGNPRDVKIAWTELDGDDIAKVLGFDHTADDTSTSVAYPVFTADYVHGYGWYADEDGLLEEMPLVNLSEAKYLQDRTDGGKVKTQLVNERYSSFMQLQHVPRLYMFSGAVGYGETSLYPYARNRPLECWWKKAIQGIRFRVYRHSTRDTTNAIAAFTPQAASTSTTLVTTGVTIQTEPQIYKGMIIYQDDYIDNAGRPMCWHIASNTAANIVATQANILGYEFDATNSTAYIFDETYDTYVLDLQKMSMFEPTEIGNSNRFNIKIPLLKYVS